MKRITAIALLTIASFVTAGSALAADRGVEATVPFDFTVGNHLLPAGTYTIASPSSNVLEIRNAEGRIVATTVALLGQRRCQRQRRPGVRSLWQQVFSQ